MKTSKMLDGYPQRSCARPPSSRFASPPLRGPASPLRGFPPCARFLSPLRRAFLKPPLRRRYAAPLCAASPHTRGAAAPLRWTLAPLRVARGMAAPASATAPPLARRGAAFAGGWPSSPRRHAFGVHGWASGGTRSLALARLRLGRCPRRVRHSSACGGLADPPVAERSAGFFAAFCRALPPCGLRVGARAYFSRSSGEDTCPHLP